MYIVVLCILFGIEPDVATHVYLTCIALPCLFCLSLLWGHLHVSALANVASKSQPKGLYTRFHKI